MIVGILKEIKVAEERVCMTPAGVVAMVHNGHRVLVEKADGSLPLLLPMSEVAGRMAAQEGAKYLEMPMGGQGILLGGVTGVEPGTVVVIGGGDERRFRHRGRCNTKGGKPL